MPRHVHAVFGAVAVAGWLAASACRTPTQVTLVISTTVPCKELAAGTSITVAATPESTEDAVKRGFSSGSTRECSTTGAIGSLVVTPGGEKAAIVVTAGFGGQDTATCTPENAYKNCIVARRSFTFVEHASLDLPIELTPDCVNVPCGALSTCNKGTCVPSSIDCTGDGCAAIGSGADAGSPDSATPDSAAPDSTAPDSAAPDGGLTSDPLCGVTGGGPMAVQDFRVTKGLDRYCIDRTEVTQLQYAAFLALELPKKPGCPAKTLLDPVRMSTAVERCDETTFTPLTTPHRPVVCVDKCDADTYCAAVGKRLCVGEEWPAACQNGEDSRGWPYGPTFQPTTCNGSGFGAGQTRDVGTTPGCINAGAATAVFDMSGNVWEWSQGIARGGGFLAGSNELGCRFAGGVPNAFTNEIGFRCCKSAP